MDKVLASLKANDGDEAAALNSLTTPKHPSQKQR
jgi:hypothetical protein